MTLIQAIILGIIQGLTEFPPHFQLRHWLPSPISSTGTCPAKEMFIFNILVQLGTLTAVIIYFWKDLVAILKGFFQALFAGKPFSTHEARMGWLLIIATIPAGLAGLFLNDLIEQAFPPPW